MEMLKVCMFGTLRVCLGDKACRFPTTKAKDLFCYLLLNRRRVHSRNVLAGLFWGELAEERARKCLRTTLWRLQTLLSPGGEEQGRYVIVEDDEIHLNTESSYWLDVEEFEKGVAALSQAGPPRPDDPTVAALVSAVGLYEGDLLEGSYEDWCLYERERLLGLFLRALTRLMVHYRQAGDYKQAIQYGQQSLTFDPLLEQVHRELMRLHVLDGNRGAALRQYQQCAAALKKELGIEPMEDTKALYRQISSEGGAPAEPPAPPTLPPGRAGRTDGPADPGHVSEPTFELWMSRALSELQQVNERFQELSIRFDKGISVLERIKRELDQKPKR